MLTIMSGWVELRNRNNDRNFTLLLRAGNPLIQSNTIYYTKNEKNLKIKMTIDK